MFPLFSVKSSDFANESTSVTVGCELFSTRRANAYRGSSPWGSLFLNVNGSAISRVNVAGTLSASSDIFIK